MSWLDWRPDDAWLDIYDVAQDRAAAAARAPGAAAAALPRGPADRRGRPEGPRLDPPRGPGDDRGRLVRRRLHTFGMFVSGDPLRAPGPQGEQLHDSSFLLWFNAHGDPGKATIPRNQWVQQGRGGAEHRQRAPDRRAGLGRRGARHRAALDDRAPPALTGVPTGQSRLIVTRWSRDAHAWGSATRPSSASDGEVLVRGSTRTV